MTTDGAAIAKNTVIVRRLRADGGDQDFKDFRPLSADMTREVERHVAGIFDTLGGASLLKSSRDVYIKPNVVGTSAYVYTRPEVVEATIRYWQRAGARDVYVIENCTQANCTRLVFETTGYNAVCKRTGAIAVYLDEDEEVECEFAGKRSVAVEERGYDLTKFAMPRFVYERLMRECDANLYIDVPKLKTHSMSIVTLGIKNQWGFPVHRHRSPDHNFNLHHKLVDVLALLRPDVTLIEGVEGTIYGHYPARATLDRCVRPFRVLIGGLNVVAVDVVGARVFGKRIEDVPHLKIAIERGLGDGVRGDDDITISGDCSAFSELDLLDEWAAYGGQYPDDLIPEYPPDVRIIRGKELACREGCVNNSFSVLQGLYFDQGGRGGWTLVVGKGFDDDVVASIDGKVLLVGPCSVEEIGPKLVARLGSRNVYMSRECNDLAALVESMCHLMKVSPLQIGPPVSPLKALVALVQSKWNGSSARMTNVFADWIKLR